MKKVLDQLMKILSVREWMIIAVSLLISGLIASSVFWLPNSSNSSELTYDYFGYDLRIETTTGEKLTPFYTIFQVVYEQQRPKEEKERVKAIISELVPYLHQLSDRHHDFLVEGSETELVNNIKKVNESLMTGIPVTIDFHLYEMLRLGVTMGKISHGKFNMFLGEISAFWNDLLDDPDYAMNVQEWDPHYSPTQQAKLDHYLQFIPTTETEFDQLLTLTNTEGVYTALLHPWKGATEGDVSITLGAIAKGYANDVIASTLQEEGLTYGFINNGSSSIITLGEKSDDTPYTWNVTSPSTLLDYAFEIEMTQSHALSTSGSYNGRVVNIEGVPTLRHHIIDPVTGYPSSYVYEVNAVSTDLPSIQLDMLTTALMTMDIQEGYALYQAFIQQGYDLYLSWIDIQENQTLKVSYTEDFIDYINPFDEITYELVSFS